MLVYSNQLSGCLLMATPMLQDHPFYSNAVIYVYDYSEDGVQGVAINKRMQCSMQELINRLSTLDKSSVINDDPILNGGLSAIDRGIILHSDDLGQVFDVSFSKEMLLDIAKGRGPAFHQVFLGYTSWTHEGFAKELKAGYWLMSRQDLRELFAARISDRYHMVATHIGVGNPAYVSCEQAEA
ncbi:MAG: YqgE/AlgH family protein [Gammaproteobacteria bacterium]|nr:YqgE/AlgH family protein [Gammaproteobacteria bacterium]